MNDDDSSFSSDSDDGIPQKVVAKKPAATKRKKIDSDEEDEFKVEGESDSDSAEAESEAESDESDSSPKAKKAKTTKAPAAATKAPAAAKGKAAPKGKAAAGAKATKEPAAAKGKAAAAKGGATKSTGAKGKSEPVKAVAEKDAAPLILDFLKQKNRPYNAQTMFDSLHGQVKKPHVVRVLETLATSNQILCKEFGKNKVYFPNQSDYEDVSPEEFVGLEETEKSLEGEVTELKEQLKSLSSELAASQSQLTTEAAKLQIEKLKQENEALQNKLNIMQSGGVKPVSDQEMKAAKKKLEDKKKIWRKAKRACMNVVELICDNENVSKKPRELMEEVGIETDEDVNMTIDKLKH
eukprot:c18466_g1_i2.p1 GENE.c18466_g1_i2~~c18466_g1_i2.p1  ORF type:complete len:352 (-),score=200.97 c18466_g1_i2:31-1086(-)